MRTQQGFTLAELLTAISVMGITLVVGVPAMIDVIHSNRLSTQTNILITTLNTARSEAIKRGQKVSVCAGNDTACATNWTNGMVVFMDSNANNTVDGGEEVIRVFGKINGGNTLGAVDGGGDVTILGYSSAGNSTHNSTVTFTLCDPSKHKSRVLSLAPVGNLSTSSSTC